MYQTWIARNIGSHAAQFMHSENRTYCIASGLGHCFVELANLRVLAHAFDFTEHGLDFIFIKKIFQHNETIAGVGFDLIGRQRIGVGTVGINDRILSGNYG